MISIKFLHSLFFALLGYVLYLKYSKGLIKAIYTYSLIIMFFALFLYNLFFNGLSNHLFLFALMFSFGFVVLQLMKKFVTIFEKDKELEKNKSLRENILSAQQFILNKLFVAFLVCYQILLIWYPEIYQRIIEKP